MRIALCVLILGSAACGANAASPPTASATSAVTAPPPPAHSFVPVKDSLDAKMAELTKDLRGCVSTHPLLLDCKGLEEFESSTDPYFATDAADHALVDMLTGADTRLAMIATKRDGHDPKKALLDKEGAMRLFDTIERKDCPTPVVEASVKWLSYADFRPLGLGDRLVAFARNPDRAIRKAVASRIFRVRSDPDMTSPEIRLAEALLADSDDDVVKSTADSLASVDSFEACDLLITAVRHADARTDDVIEAASRASRCGGVAYDVIRYLEKATKDPKAMRKSTGSAYVHAARNACGAHTFDAQGKAVFDTELRGKAFDVLFAMTNAHVPERETRLDALVELVACDWKRSKPILEQLKADKDGSVARRAKQELEDIADAEAHAAQRAP